MAGGREQRRAELAIDEAQDVRDAAQKARDENQRLMDEIDQAMQDDVISSDEARRIVDQSRRANAASKVVSREAAQVVVATEWTSVGELQAIAKLTGRDSDRAAIRELDVRRRAIDVGLSLTT